MSSAPIQVVCPNCNATNNLQTYAPQVSCGNCHQTIDVGTASKKQIVSEPVASNVDESAVFPPLPNSALAQEMANPAKPTGPVEQLNYPPGMAPPGSQPAVDPKAAHPTEPTVNMTPTAAATPTPAPVMPPGAAQPVNPATQAAAPILPPGAMPASNPASPSSPAPNPATQLPPGVNPTPVSAAPQFSVSSNAAPKLQTKPVPQTDADGNPIAKKPDAKSIGMIVGMVGIGLFIIIAGVLGITILSKLLNQPPKTYANPNLEVVNDPKIPWAEAGKSSAKVRKVSIKVDFVKYDEIRGKDAAHKVQDSKGEKFLQIFLELRNRGPTLDYKSWYSEDFDVIMVDEEGNRLDLMLFEDVVKIQGQANEISEFKRNERMDDVLVFDLPEGKLLEDISMFYLTLPGEAFGGNSKIYFKIDPKIINKAGDGVTSGLPKSTITLDE